MNAKNFYTDHDTPKVWASRQGGQLVILQKCERPARWNGPCVQCNQERRRQPRSGTRSPCSWSQWASVLLAMPVHSQASG